MIGQTVGTFLVKNIVGKGGFGIVMEAMDTATKKTVAFKFLNPLASVDDLLDFKNEGDLLGRLDGSSNVVELIKSDQHSFTLKTDAGLSIPVSLSFHVLEFAQGTLETIVLNRHQLDWIQRLLLWRGVIKGVHQMHLRFIVHRDLKSENCLVFDMGKNKTDCKVTDLGRSRHLPSPPLHTPQDYMVGRGDMRFAPPEFLAWQGNDDAESHICADLYGLGAILFELATGLPITFFALGYHADVLQMNLELLNKGEQIDLTGMRSQFEPAYALFEHSVPPVIRQQIGIILRQLCDPLPTGRLPKSRFSQKSVADGLVWLLTWTDSLIRSLEAENKRARLAAKTGRYEARFIRHGSS